MADDSEFLSRLISFGLSEKEAQLYLHLLKYGPKPPSMLAKSLKTYREDVYRTVTSLIDNGLVNPSLSSPTVYTAVELPIALDAALKKHEIEFREMEKRVQELRELSKQQQFRPSDESTTFTVIKNNKDARAFMFDILPSMEKEILWIGPELAPIAFSMYGSGEAIAAQVIPRGGRARGITDITCRSIKAVQQHLDWGHDVRHIDKYSGLNYAVYDRKYAVSPIYLDMELLVKRLSPDVPGRFLVTNDPTYIEYLISTFELFWNQAVPAAQRIEELLEVKPLRRN